MARAVAVWKKPPVTVSPPKALPLLRGYYDWYNRQAFLPDMLRATARKAREVAHPRVGVPPRLRGVRSRF